MDSTLELAMRSPLSVAVSPSKKCVMNEIYRPLHHDGVCHHQLQNNTVDNRCQPPVTQFNSESVIVTARNIVGRSSPAVSRSINKLSMALL